MKWGGGLRDGIRDRGERGRPASERGLEADAEEEVNAVAVSELSGSLFTCT